MNVFKNLRKLIQLRRDITLIISLLKMLNDRLIRIEKALNRTHLKNLKSPEDISNHLNISIETLRSLRKKFHIKSYSSGHKIFLDEKDVVRALQPEKEIKLNTHTDL
ncbi:hypothetical protein EYV94_21555 [Puteibacter caeruleilacunae]|nr:hypothetical protein EYV94_21555 [Puteibacter caeruleilacunae]